MVASFQSHVLGQGVISQWIECRLWMQDPCHQPCSDKSPIHTKHWTRAVWVWESVLSHSHYWKRVERAIMCGDLNPDLSGFVTKWAYEQRDCTHVPCFLWIGLIGQRVWGHRSAWGGVEDWNEPQSHYLPKLPKISTSGRKASPISGEKMGKWTDLWHWDQNEMTIGVRDLGASQCLQCQRGQVSLLQLLKKEGGRVYPWPAMVQNVLAIKVASGFVNPCSY